jgi:TonB family protein
MLGKASVVTCGSAGLAEALHLKLRPDVSGGEAVRFQEPKRRLIAVQALWVFFLSVGAIVPGHAFAQAEVIRKVKTRVSPSYPDLARRLSIRGTVKVVVVVSPSGDPKDARVVGGNPVLVNAALDAVKKWKFEPATDESTVTLEFDFQPKRPAE